MNTATCCCVNRTTSFCYIWHCHRCLQQSLDFTALAELCLLISLIDGLVVVIQEYDFVLCRGSSGGSQTVSCLWPITIVFQFKYISIKCNQVLGGRVDSVRRGRIFCNVQNGYICTWIWLLGLYAAHQTSGDQWKTTDYVFDRHCMFSLQASPGDKGFPLLTHPVKAEALLLSNDQYSLWMPSSQCKNKINWTVKLGILKLRVERASWYVTDAQINSANLVA